MSCNFKQGDVRIDFQRKPKFAGKVSGARPDAFCAWRGEVPGFRLGRRQVIEFAGGRPCRNSTVAQPTPG
jgi:hypothetical protein